MSRLRTQEITNYSGDGAVEFTKGATLESGYDVRGTVTINTAGVCTATSFVGDGSALTNVGGASAVSSGKMISLINSGVM